MDKSNRGVAARTVWYESGMKRTRSATLGVKLATLGVMAVPGLIFGTACSSEPSGSGVLSTSAPSYPNTAHSFRMQAKGLAHAYDVCAQEIVSSRTLDSQCRYAAEVYDEKVRSLQSAAKSMEGGWPNFVSAAREILEASELNLQSCTGSFETLSADGVLNLCITARRTLQFADSELEKAVTLDTVHTE